MDVRPWYRHTVWPATIGKKRVILDEFDPDVSIDVADEIPNAPTLPPLDSSYLITSNSSVFNPEVRIARRTKKKRKQKAKKSAGN